MSGATLSFTEADLADAARVYDPTLHEAPIVVGHPAHDLPAYGWVSALVYSDGDIDHDPGLYATPAQVNTDFADMVAAGAFKKISAAFYAPTAPSNPKPGSFYLRHVGFLGAQPPAVKGLRSPSFADGEEGVVVFSEWDDQTNASLWRGLRDWVLAKFGQEEADKAIPGYQVGSLEQGAQDALTQSRLEAQAPLSAAFADPAQPVTNPPETTVTPEEKAAVEAKAAAIEAENQALRAELAAQKTAQVHAANVAFAERLTSEGRLLPAYKDLAVATLDHFALLDRPVEFGEGEAKKPLADQLKDMLAAAPKTVVFGEHATTARAALADATAGAADDAAFAESADPARLAQHKAIQAHMALHKVDYATAARAVLK